MLLFYELDFKGHNYADWAKTCWYLVENPFSSVPVLQLGCTSVLLIDILEFWGRLQSFNGSAVCGHHCLPWLDILILHEVVGAAVEITVVLPVLDDGFRIKKGEFMGDKGAVA